MWFWEMRSLVAADIARQGRSEDIADDLKKWQNGEVERNSRLFLFEQKCDKGSTSDRRGRAWKEDKKRKRSGRSNTRTEQLWSPMETIIRDDLEVAVVAVVSHNSPNSDLRGTRPAGIGGKTLMRKGRTRVDSGQGKTNQKSSHNSSVIHHMPHEPSHTRTHSRECSSIPWFRPNACHWRAAVERDIAATSSSWPVRVPNLYFPTATCSTRSCGVEPICPLRDQNCMAATKTMPRR